MRSFSALQLESLTAQYTTADSTQHVVSAASNGKLSETWFNPGTVNGWDVPLNPSPGTVTAVTSDYTTADSTMHVFWGAPDGNARETWYRPGVVNTWGFPG